MLRGVTVFAFLFVVFGATASAQNVVSGTVTSEESMEPLAGVNIVIDGTSEGTSTDAEGNFELSVPDSAVTLEFTFVGYETQRIDVEGETELDVTMPVSTTEADEVVVVGYGQQSKSDLTGSVSSVEPDDIARVSSNSITESLQGKIAGVQITPEDGSPGAQSTVRIRGVGTLNDASPLYVVDGNLTDDISNISSRDIESVEVLKDASATAIYGSRGANGVIIITTKSGEEGEPSLEYNGYYGWQEVANKIDLTNANEYATLANELAENEGNSEPFSDPDEFGQGTDWQDQIFRTAPIQNHQLSASGGSEDITYNISGSYSGQEGIVRDSDYERITFRLNNNYSLTDNIDFGHNANITYRSWLDEAGGIISTLYRADPTISPRNEDGEFSNANVRASSGNPAATVNYNNFNENAELRTAGNTYLDIDFLENFNFRSSLALDFRNAESKSFVPEYEVSPVQQNEDDELNVTDTKERDILWENTLNYQQDFDVHQIEALAGFTTQEYRNEVLGGRRINFPGETDDFWYLSAGESDGQTNENTAYEWGMISYLFRANYTYDERYLFTGTYRIDGSSRFGENNRYGYFPSVAGGWNVSNESFMENAEPISDLKLRASWGIIGNDKIDAYPGVPTVTSNLNAVFGPDEDLRYGATLTELANPDIQWEETIQSDIGVELGLWDNQFLAEVDFYNRKTEGILVEIPIPFYVGVGSNSPFVNAAEVENEGIDVNLNWQQDYDDFSYNIGAVFSTVSNEVLSLGDGQDYISGGGLGNEISSTTRTEVGEPIGSFYGYKVEGVYQNQQEIDDAPTDGGVEPGDLRFADTNDDGEINGDDRQYLGSPIPDFSFGLNLETSYKNVDLALNFDGQYGNKIFNAKKATRFGIENFETSYLDRWNGEGTSDSEPRVTNAGHNYQASDRFIEDGSFLRLNNAQIGYTLPTDLLDQIDLNDVRIYMSGRNLFTLTEYSGYSPQIGGSSVIASGIDEGTYPSARSITVGLDVAF